MRLLLDKLSLYVTLGFHPWERVIKRLVYVNVSISSKDLIDYSEVIHSISASVVKKRFDYVEDLTDELVAILVDQFSPIKLSLEVVKPSFSRFLASASVCCEYNK